MASCPAYVVTEARFGTCSHTIPGFAMHFTNRQGTKACTQQCVTAANNLIPLKDCYVEECQEHGLKGCLLSLSLGNNNRYSLVANTTDVVLHINGCRAAASTWSLDFVCLYNKTRGHRFLPAGHGSAHLMRATFSTAHVCKPNVCNTSLWSYKSSWMLLMSRVTLSRLPL